MILSVGLFSFTLIKLIHPISKIQYFVAGSIIIEGKILEASDSLLTLEVVDVYQGDKKTKQINIEFECRDNLEVGYQYIFYLQYNHLYQKPMRYPYH